MLTEFVRDHAFTIAWFGLMAVVWFGWGQEDPPDSWRWKLGVGSGLGVVLAGLFGYGMVIRWNEGGALDGQEAVFGQLVGAEVLLAGLGCLWLWRSRRTRWSAWWVALVVALHFVPLAFILRDWSLVGLGLLQAIGLAALMPRLRRADGPTSRLVGPLMGVSLLGFGLLSSVVFLVRSGTPW